MMRDFLIDNPNIYFGCQCLSPISVLLVKFVMRVPIVWKINKCDSRYWFVNTPASLGKILYSLRKYQLTFTAQCHI